MKKKLLLVLSVLFLAGFALYAMSDSRFSGPLDKLVQLLTLVPAVVFLAISGFNPLNRIIRTLGKVSTGQFLTIICSAAALFTLYMALIPLEGIPKGGDEAAYLFQSRIFHRGHLTAPAPSVDNPRDLFPFRHFIFRSGEWFVMYTPLHGLLMAPFTGAGVSWIMGPLESILSLFGAFLLFRRVAGERIARMAALVMAISPFFLFMGCTHMAHNTNLLLVTWSLYALVRGVQTESSFFQVLAGFLLGLALNTKPYPIIPWTLTISLVLFIKLRVRAIPVLLRIAAGALLPALLFLYFNHRYTGNPFSPPYNLARGGELMGFGENRAWFPEYGDHSHTPLRGLINLLKQAGTGSTILLGWPFLSLIPAVLPGLRRNLLRKTWPLYASVLLIAPFMFIHYAAAIDYGPRHYFTALPSFALLTAVGITVIKKKWGETGQRLVIGLFAFCTILVYLPDGAVLRSQPWQSIDSEPLRLARDVVETPAVVFMEASEHGYPNIMSGLLATDPFLDGDIVFCAHQTTQEDSSHIQNLFSNRNPYLFYTVHDTQLIEEWTPELSDRVSPERELRPSWVPENHPSATL